MRAASWIPALSLVLALTACDSGPHVIARTDSAPLTVGANLTGTVLRIPNPQELPEAIRASNDLLVTVDTSKATLPVVKDADGSYTINFGTLAPRLDTAGNMTVLFQVDHARSQLVTLRTGPAISLGSPAIVTTPSPAAVLRGFAVSLKANVPAEKTGDYTYSWFYSTLPASGVWTGISGNTATVSWTPANPGNYYLRLDVTEKATLRNSSFITSSALVNVAEGTDIIKTNPFPASVDRGVPVGLSIPPVKDGAIYTWSYATASTGPWSPVLTDAAASAKGSSVSWNPPSEGNFYIKVDVTDPVAATTSTFTSSQPLVFVAERTPLITTDPNPARVTTTTGINLHTRLVPKDGDVFGWSYGASQLGPWTAIGGSTSQDISWTATRAVGTYYIKLDVTNSATGASNSYVSKTPLIYVDSTTNANSQFGR